MTGWSRVPLRLRVALAFAATTALALLALGVFLHVQVAGILEEQVRTGLATRVEALQRLSEAERDEVIGQLSGESFGQVVDADGTVRVSSPQLREPLLGTAALPEVGGTTTTEARVFLRDEGEVGDAVLTAVRPSSEVIVVGTATEDAAEVLEGLRVQLLVGGAATLLLAGFAGYVVAGSALRPMERMRAHAATISSGSSGERLPLPEVRDEVHRLGRTLNDMLDRLDDGLRRERRFVAEASHELRTPLALLRTELDLAVSRPRSEEELAAFLASATEEVDRLSLLVDHLLQLARADQDRLELQRAPFPVRGLLEEVAARFRHADEVRRVSVAPGPDVELVADRRRLDQAVTNLVDNALRHGRGDVRLDVAAQAGRVRVTVTDEGTSRPDDAVFDRFRRGDDGRAGGRGLGLALVRAIVAEHGGTVAFDPTASTTTVVLDLPT